MCAHPRRPARAPGAAARPRRQGRQEDPDLGRRALQLHQPRERGPRRSCRPTRISASRRWRATPSTISSPWSTSTASPGTRRRWASCSATARRGRSWPCCWPNARRPASTCGSAHRITGDREGRPLRGAHRPGRLRRARPLVLATGGLSIPKMGATGFAHDVARRFGLTLAETRPALVPLTLEGAGAAAACRCEVVARCGRGGFREAMLFTHRGLSGPAILQISSYWQRGPGDRDRPAARHRRGAVPQGAQARAAQGRAAHGAGRAAAAAAGAKPRAGRRDGQPARPRARDARGAAEGWQSCPTGTEGYAKAEVTRGRHRHRELSSRPWRRARCRAST